MSNDRSYKKQGGGGASFTCDEAPSRYMVMSNETLIIDNLFSSFDVIDLVEFIAAGICSDII